jgi:hypothetical protein
MQWASVAHAWQRSPEQIGRSGFVQSTSARHSTHLWSLQTAAAEPQSAFPKHSTQSPEPSSQKGLP